MMPSPTSYFDTPYHPLRPFLLMRLTYLLLAGDLWFGMVQHGGRYGLGSFNVAHFALLDVLLPLPSPSLYVAMLLFSGFVSLSLALFSQPRWLRLLLAASYSLAWMISIHDSYQHHYFISWLLVWCAAMPAPSLASASRSGDERVRGWGLPMACITCAIVYAFTGVAKSEAGWRRGDVLRALARAGEQGRDWGGLGPLREPLHALGLSDSVLWAGFAYTTIGLQWVIAIAYLLAARRDLQPARWRTVLLSIGLVGAVCFHASAELFGHFEIGVFSYYMLALALVLLGPLVLLRPIASGLCAWSPVLERMTSALSGSESWWRLGLLVLMVSVLGLFSDLPGARSAGLGVAALVAWRLIRAQRVDPESARLLALQTAVCALMMWLALDQSSMVFDFYRRTAGELRRMGQATDALAAYRIAERHAPTGQSRAHEIRELEVELRSKP